MNAEIIAVGSELLLGQISNTNAQFISQQLAHLGVNVYFHTAVGDNPTRLKEALDIAEKRADIIILTGGLGPTKDDLTKETVAEQINKNLVIDKDAQQTLEEHFEQTKRIMTENNRKQAYVIEGATILKNDHGMAPGMLLEANDCLYMLLPGPPKEMRPMFLSYGYNALANKMTSKEQIVSRVLRFFGIGEAQLETKIADILDAQTNPTLAPLSTDSEVSLRLTAKAATFEEATPLLDKLEGIVMDRVGEFFYGYDETSLMNELVKKLTAKGLTLASAESLTGGMFQQRLTAIPGASAVFKGGVVTYANEAKVALLHVKEETIRTDGVVSAQCAQEMAENVRKLLETDIGISFTGVAGPDMLEGVPVGTVYIGIAEAGKETMIHKLHLGFNRELNRRRSVSYGCYYLLKR